MRQSVRRRQLVSNPFEPPASDVRTLEHEATPLLPRWIRFFCWAFLVGGSAAAVVVPAMSLLIAGPQNFSFLGFSHVGRPSDPEALLVLALFVLFAVASYGLLWSRPWGLLAGLACGIGGLLFVIANFLQSLGTSSVVIPLEPVLQVPFVLSLWRRRSRWPQRVA